MRLSASLPEVFFSLGLNIISFGLNIALFGALFESNIPICFSWKVSGASPHCASGLLGRLLGNVIIALNRLYPKGLLTEMLQPCASHLHMWSPSRGTQCACPPAHEHFEG